MDDNDDEIKKYRHKFTFWLCYCWLFVVVVSVQIKKKMGGQKRKNFMDFFGALK